MSLIAFVGTYTHDAPDGATPGRPGHGIHVFDASGTPWKPLAVHATRNPSFLARHPHLPLLYAVNEVSEFEGNTTGAIEALTLSGAAPYLTSSETRGLAPGATAPAHLAVDAGGSYLMVSAYEGGQFNLLPLDGAGQPGQVQHVHVLHGQGAHPERQAKPHAHQSRQSPDASTWIGCDLGSDRILVWSLEQGDLVVEAMIEGRSGAGPRHAVFHPGKPWFYVINELDATLDHYVWQDFPDGRAWTLTSSATRLLSGENHPTPSGSALVMHPTGKWLFASTRRLEGNPAEADAISAWQIDPDTGSLSLLRHYTDGVDFPREMVLSPDGNALLVLNQKGGDIVAFNIDPDQGTLTSAGVVASVPTPASLVFFQPTS